MSTNRNSTLEVIVVTFKNIVEKFKDFSFDEDLNGNNGKEYLSKEAKESGFNSDLDYILNLAHLNLVLVQQHNLVLGQEQIQTFCNIVLLELPDYYCGSKIIVTKIKEEYVISFMQLMEY